jgi:hypothetical protein
MRSPWLPRRKRLHGDVDIGILSACEVIVKKSLGWILALGLLAGCEDGLVAETVGKWTGMDVPPAGVVATVNGAPIFLRQVEALSDINSPTLLWPQPVTYEELHADYAAGVNRLIVQALVREELTASGITVSDAEVLALEKMVSAGYDRAPGPDFDEVVEDAGIAPDLWREQLRARLELERWQKELAQGIHISVGEVEAYLAGHPEAGSLPAQVEYMRIRGPKETLEEMSKSGRTDTANLLARGLSVDSFAGAEAGMPRIWAEDLRNLQPGQASAMRQTGNSWGYVVLLERSEARAMTPLEAFTNVEGILIEQKLPAIFDEWLTRAVLRADIRVAGQFQPANVPRPERRPEVSSDFFGTVVEEPGATVEEGEE